MRRVEVDEKRGAARVEERCVRARDPAAAVLHQNVRHLDGKKM